MELAPLSVENEGIDFDVGSGDEEEEAAGAEIEGEDYNDDEEEFGYDSGERRDLLLSGSDQNHEPYEGMEFESEEAARIFYNSYARRVGFSTRVSVYHRSRRDGAIICRQVVCSRQGFRQARDRERCISNKRQRADTRVGCKAMVMVKKQDSGRWVVSRLIKEHNHELVPPDKVHRLRSHRHVSGPARSLIDTLKAAGIGPSGVMSVLIRESGGINNVGFTTVDCRNYMSGSRQRTRVSGVQQVVDELKRMRAENSSFFYAVEGENENSKRNVFWADADSRMNYNYFGDTVTIDTTYRSNRYRVPFAPFTGLNHHGQPVLFGCALILNESEASYIWLFQTWLTAMSGKHPVSITTDQDRIIRAAVAHAFPKVRHRFCKWSIFREAEEKLAHVHQSRPTFEADFRKCVNMSETASEFDYSWESLLKRYDLVGNEWLQSMYSVRQQWVPLYLRDTFFGETTVTQGSDTINSFFDGYVNASTAMQVLIKQYEKAVASRHEKEVKADYDTMNTTPVLKTPSPMEKQAASLFTRKIFMKFQEELVETLAITATKLDDTGTVATYRVVKFGEDHKSYTVLFHIFETIASCSCQMFEFSGIICRHILAVFRVTNVLTLPSHYALKRWTRNAKSGISVDERAIDLPGNSGDSSAVRFNNLRQEAIKFVEEGSRSLPLYNVAMDALREAGKKVAAAKTQGPVIKWAGDMANGSASDVQSSESDQLSSEGEKDKKILELLNEVQSANQRCEVYRAKLFSLLKDMEEQKLKLSIKAQSVRVSLKE
ncbi:hypothetical protein Syun_014919 [Stephania yunnanensis]|uniref:Protein FAR1-RELATED SEQUENCE n=1 Tax=Stephania yunnanensis TaxID=152371 RepID=A0AAP0JKQ5_9MAGN